MNEIGDLMKKVIPILFLVVLFINFNNNSEDIIIPDYAIRFRVIANSNTIEDQTTKLQVKTIIENKLNTLMLKAKNSEEAKNIIQDNLKEIRTIVDSYSSMNNVSFGKNYFPEKEYKGITYPSGDYESLVITLGNGSVNNWWCVMFPPLCLIDNQDNIENVDYKFYVKEVLDKYLS